MRQADNGRFGAVRERSQMSARYMRENERSVFTSEKDFVSKRCVNTIKEIEQPDKESPFFNKGRM